ncbi:hypothetical protein [Cyanobium sp. CH-040]|uniref:hypothetical protein n=1 Tax=Cyanobium sp. CH-040 TaxID=2823708 RepID=UPI0020CC531C|nr:hypothetical protein [Cyanobium sp. CH-040]
MAKISGRFHGSKQSVLIVHPEGNIHYNPSLLGIVSILSDSGYQVTVLAPVFICKDELSRHCSANLLTLRGKYFRQATEMNTLHAKWILLSRLIHTLEKHIWPSLIIGVDRDGIIISSRLSSLTGIPYALLSYEIFFECETSQIFKRPEIEACRKIKFAISQDPKRSELLSRENHISRDKIIEVPVSPRGRLILRDRRHGTSESKGGIRERYQIKHQKIAILVGSTDGWSMTNKIIASTKDWPSKWCLFIHDRYGLRAEEIEKLKARGGHNIYFSTESFSDIDDVSTMLLEADVGLAFYQPTYQNQWEGRNLKHLGLSSGKIASYLRAGLPVILNRVGQYSRLIRTYEAGIISPRPSLLPCILNRITDHELAIMSKNALRLYQKKINIERHKKHLLKAIQAGALRYS